MKIQKFTVVFLVVFLLFTVGIAAYAAQDDGFSTYIAAGQASGIPSLDGETSEPTSTPTSEPTSEPTSTPTSEPTSTPTEEPTSTPTEEPTSTPTEPPIVEVTVTYYDGETVISSETVESGAFPVSVPTVNGSGKAITNWLNASGSFVTPQKVAVTKDTAYYAWYAPDLNTTDHIKYINGLGNAQFGPNQTLTRAQAAQIIYNLLVNKQMGPYTVSFSDISSSAWYYTAVTTLASYKLITGYSNGTFLPNNCITRAEFISILSRLYTLQSGDISFTDVSAGSWAHDAIANAYVRGWVNGYQQSNGTYLFKPSNYITRAEAVTVVNNVLKRHGDLDVLLNNSYAQYFQVFIDVPTSNWAYAGIMEASLVHDHQGSGASEQWTNIYPDKYSCGLTPGFHLINGSYYHVNENDLLDKYTAGLQHIDGSLCHCSQNGFALDSYSAGFHTIDGKLYRCSKVGYAIDQYSKGTMEIGSDMYYVQADGSFLTNGYYGYLYFRANGTYTSGNATVDTYVYKILKDKNIINNTSLTQEQKLYKAYLAIRDGGYNYLNRGDGYSFGSTSFALSCAETFYTTGKGSCYYWAGGFLYLARRLGYSNAYAVVGGVNSATTRHAWVMISGYIYDVEMEWGHWVTISFFGPSVVLQLSCISQLLQTGQHLFRFK